MNTLFADTLRKLRTEKGLSQIQLANQMIVNKATISRWENGTRLPDAAMITGFIRPKEAIEYAKMNRIALAILDVELGTGSGLDLCRTLLEINPRTNVVYLTAYPEYALDAWDTDASGFMVKPLTPEGVRRQLGKLRYPIKGVSGV